MATIVAAGITSSATTAEQSVVSNTPAATTSFKCISISGYLTTYSATEAALGIVFFDVAGTNVYEARMQNTDLASLASVIVIPLGDGITFSGAQAIAWQVTPAAATSTRWYGTMWGQG
jgi:hypothetical protein